MATKPALSQKLSVVAARPSTALVEPNGAQCFRGNFSRSGDSTECGFETSLRDYLTKHEPGLSITSETARCQWRGESMNYSQAIEGMQFLERKATRKSRLPAPVEPGREARV